MVYSRINKYVFLFLRRPAFSIVRRIGNISSSNTNDLNPDDYQTITSQSVDTCQSHLETSKTVPITVEEFQNLRRLKPCQPVNPHLLKVSILGEPNVGKSTLTNNLVKWKVCAVSRKVHTTRKKASAVLVEENKQIVFLDTPGFVNPEQRKRHSLEPSFIMDPITSLRHSDLIAVVVDIANKHTNNRIATGVLEVLENFKEKKSILILNKIDAMKSKSRILSLTQILTEGVVGGFETKDLKDKLSREEVSIENIIDITNKQLHSSQEESHSDVDDSQRVEDKRGWQLFSRVFMVSALKDDGMDDLRRYLLSETIPHDWMYHDSTVTDQHPHEIALMTVREKLLEYLPEEIPYSLDLRVSKWELLSTGCPKIDIKIICSNARHRRFVIGPAGRHIATCADKSRRAMREAFRKDVVLHLAVV